MQIRKKDPVHVASGLLLLVTILLLVGVIMCPTRNVPSEKSRQEPGPDSATATSSVSPPLRIDASIGSSCVPSGADACLKPEKKENSRVEYRRNFITGSIFFNGKQYRQAADCFHKAEAIYPAEPSPRYYLMLCYQKLENKPYAPGSMTLRMALETKTLAPGTPMAEEADKVLRKASTQTVTSKQAALVTIKPPVRTPTIKKPVSRPSDPPKVTTDDQVPYPIGLPTPGSPTDTPAAPEPQQTTPKVSTGKVTLTGIVSRPDEHGVTIFPGGAEVTLVGINQAGSYRTVTDAEGKYTFTGLEPGRSYYLVAQSKYLFQRPVKDFYYRYNRPYCPPVFQNDDKDKKKKKSPQSRSADESSRVQQVPTGGGYVYYPGMYVEEIRLVPTEFNVSWHLRVTLEDSGIFRVNLDKHNSDGRYIADVRPVYDPVTYKPYEEVKDVCPVEIQGE